MKTFYDRSQVQNNFRQGNIRIYKEISHWNNDYSQTYVYYVTYNNKYSYVKLNFLATTFIISLSIAVFIWLTNGYV